MLLVMVQTTKRGLLAKRKEGFLPAGNGTNGEKREAVEVEKE